MERERERKQKAERRTQTEINSERKKQNRRSYDHLGGATPSDRQRFYAPDVNAASSRRQRNVADVRPNSTEFLPNFSIQILLLSNPPSLSLHLHDLTTSTRNVSPTVHQRQWLLSPLPSSPHQPVWNDLPLHQDCDSIFVLYLQDKRQRKRQRKTVQQN